MKNQGYYWSQLKCRWSIRRTSFAVLLRQTYSISHALNSYAGPVVGTVRIIQTKRNECHFVLNSTFSSVGKSWWLLEVPPPECSTNFKLQLGRALFAHFDVIFCGVSYWLSSCRDLAYNLRSWCFVRTLENYHLLANFLLLLTFCWIIIIKINRVPRWKV